MSFDVLSRTLNVFGSHFLEASAGTGKTFAIEHLVTRLLIESENPLRIDQVLVVTFTRVAARELKSRIWRNLIRAKEELFRGNASVDYLRAICERGEEATGLAVQRLEAALICYDGAQIYTLHGFCHRILKEFAFEANVGMQVADPDQMEHLSILEEMVKEHLKEGVRLPDYSPEQIRSVLKKKQRDPRRLISSLVDLVASGKEIAQVLSYGQVLDSLMQKICAFERIEAEKLRQDFSLLILQYKQMTGPEIASQIELVCEIVSSKSCSVEKFDALLAGDFFLEKIREDNKKVRVKFLESSSLNYPHLIQSIQSAFLEAIKVAKDPNRTLLRLAKDLQEKGHAILEKRGKFSPDSLLLKVEQALKIPQFSKLVSQKFRAAIIDEFQDTDPIQWAIFQELFLSKMDALCLVGDPKQSIYAFRNADVYVYLSAAKAMGASSKKYLDTNFRSTPVLVAALNLLFLKAGPNWMDLPEQKEALEVMAVKAGSSLSSKEGEAPIAFFVAVDKQGRSKRFPTQECLEKKIFPYLASTIDALHTQRDVPYHEIAILVKDRFQGQAVVDYLKECGIPAKSRRSGSLIETKAYFALKEILAAALVPSDRSRLKCALAGPLIYQDFPLDSFLLEAKAKMQKLHQILFEKGFALFFQTLLYFVWGDSKLPLLQEIFLRKEISLYEDLQKLSELLIEEERKNNLSPGGLLIYLEEMLLLKHREDPALKVSSQEEKQSVAVMTVHMSKGLEFEAVFALGLASRHRASEHVMIKEEGKKRLGAFDPLDAASLLHIQEIDAEKMRQLYVALTRAKRYLYIPLVIAEDKKNIEYGSASAVELFFAHLLAGGAAPGELYERAQKIDLGSISSVLDPLCSLITYQILEEREAPTFKIEQKDPPEMVFPPSSPLVYEEKKILSFSSLAKKETLSLTAVAKIPEDAPLSIHTLPMGSETGTLLHLLFEKIFKRSLHHPLDEEGISQLIDEEVLFSPLEPWRPILLEWIVALLTKRILSFSLCDIPKSRLQQEVEFLFATDLGMMKGFADLLFEQDGKYYLLDWKSNYLGSSDVDYTEEKMKEAMQGHEYFMQASIYTEALERYVKLFDTRPFSECFGGAIYYFVRGRAVYHFIPSSYLGGQR